MQGAAEPMASGTGPRIHGRITSYTMVAAVSISAWNAILGSAYETETVRSRRIHSTGTKLA